MAKGQDLSRHQRGIVNRYYEHRDTIMSTKLAEIVSELYLATDDKKAEKLWKSAQTALANTKTDPKIIESIIKSRDIKKLAEVVSKLSAARWRSSSSPSTRSAIACSSSPRYSCMYRS